jgi:Cu-Zn family superoxide dismutase
MRALVTALAILAFTTAAARAQDPSAPDFARDAPSGTAPGVVRAPMRDLHGNDLGEVRARDTNAGLLIVLDLVGAPIGTHGFHVHAVGRCEPPFESAGPHLALNGKAHGFLAPGGPHAGDLVNVEVPDEGRLTQSLLAPGLRLADLRDADGSAFVLHAQADDYTSQPAGSSGDRIACARIDPVVAGPPPR